MRRRFRRLPGVPTEDRILTVPNLVSLGRLACVPIFLWLLFGRHDRAGAAYLLGALGATDWVDGWLARRFGQVSTVGKVLDPTADRVLLGVGVAAILADGAVPAWLGWTVVTREALVSAAVLVLAAAGAARIDVAWVGKAGTFGLMWAFPLFLVSHAPVSWDGTARVLAWVFAVPGLALSLYAAVAYLPRCRVALREGRAARVGVST